MLQDFGIGGGRADNGDDPPGLHQLVNEFFPPRIVLTPGRLIFCMHRFYDRRNQGQLGLAAKNHESPGFGEAVGGRPIGALEHSLDEGQVNRSDGHVFRPDAPPVQDRFVDVHGGCQVIVFFTCHATRNCVYIALDCPS